MLAAGENLAINTPLGGGEGGAALYEIIKKK